jgi:hypothetical protein
MTIMHKSQASNDTQVNNSLFISKAQKLLDIFTRTASALTQPSISKFDKVRLPKILRPHNFILQDQSAKLLPKERVANCLKKRIKASKDIQVCFNTKDKSCSWGNLQRCGSVWSCPVCAKKITEGRRHELKKITEGWNNQENSTLFLLGLTNSHTVSTNLEHLVEGQKKALKYFFSGRKSEKLFDLLRKEHQVRCFEVTYGKNGWHPHYHIVLFSNKYDNLHDAHVYSYAQHELRNLWIHSCEKANIPLPDYHHGLDLQPVKDVFKYVTKWGISEELTKGHVKQGYDSYTPFDLLNLSIDDLPIFMNKLPSKLFQDFAISFKNSRQLCFTKGLKTLFDVQDVTDQHIADDTDNLSLVVQEVKDTVFTLLKKHQVRHLYLDWVLADITKYGLDNMAKIDYLDDYNNSVVKQNIDLLLLKELD